MLHTTFGSLKAILALYPEGQRLAAVKLANNYGDTVLHRAAHNFESLKAILALYPEGQRLAAVKLANNYGDTVLHRAAHNFESLNAILVLLSENDRSDAMLVACEYIKKQYEEDTSGKPKQVPPFYSVFVLYLTIQVMEQRVNSWPEFASDENYKMFFNDLKNKAYEFYVNYSDDAQALNSFKSEFKQLLHRQDKLMASHRQIWKPIIVNLLIALTGVGLIVIAGNAAWNVVTKTKNKQEIYASDLMFFAKTRRQQQIERIEKKLVMTKQTLNRENG